MRLDWRRERYVWVPTGTVGVLQSLGLEAQALLVYLARLCDARGFIRSATSDGPRGGIARLCGAHRHERQYLGELIERFVEQGALVESIGGIELPEFMGWQRTRDPRRRLYERETPAFTRLPAFTRALAAHLSRVCDDEGLIACGGAAEWAEASSHSQYGRADLRRRLARRTACHLDALAGIGFLGLDADGLRVLNHRAAQRLHENPRAEEQATHTRPTTGPHSTDNRATLDRQPTDNRATPAVDLSQRNATDQGVPPSRSVPSLPPVLPSVPSTVAPAAVASTVPPQGQAPAPGKPAVTKGEQIELFPGEPQLAAKPRRRSRVSAPKIDEPLLPGDPGYEVYVYITTHAMFRLLVVKPGEFVRCAIGTYTLVDVGYHVARAGEWILASDEPFSDGRAFLRTWLAKEQRAAQRKLDIAAVIGARPEPAARGKAPATTAPAPTGRFVEATAAGAPVAVSPWKGRGR